MPRRPFRRSSRFRSRRPTQTWYSDVQTGVGVSTTVAATNLLANAADYELDDATIMAIRGRIVARPNTTDNTPSYVSVGLWMAHSLQAGGTLPDPEDYNVRWLWRDFLVTQSLASTFDAPTNTWDMRDIIVRVRQRKQEQSWGLWLVTKQSGANTANPTLAWNISVLLRRS